LLEAINRIMPQRTLRRASGRATAAADASDKRARVPPPLCVRLAHDFPLQRAASVDAGR
jgi:hypothetical protein